MAAGLQPLLPFVTEWRQTVQLALFAANSLTPKAIKSEGENCRNGCILPLAKL